MVLKRKSKFCLLGAVIACVLPIKNAYAIEIVKGEKAGLEMFGTGQLLGMGQHVNDTVKKSDRVYLFMQQSRLGFAGHVEDDKFYTELGLGGENVTQSNSNPALTLLEMRFDTPLTSNISLRLGQFKTPYGGEFLTPDNQRLFTESSVANLGANWGREIGLALTSKMSDFSWALGVFTGGGLDTSVLPIHALPENLGVPLMVARLGFDNTTGDALVHKQANVFKVDQTETALYLQGAYQVDSFIGHSSVVGIKAGQANNVYQQSLLLNKAWNPYISLADKAKIYGFGLTGMMRTMVGEAVLTTEFEANISGFKADLGSLTMRTARVQGALAVKPWEIALRAATVVPDKMMGPAGFAGLIEKKPFYEITPALSYYLKDWSKLVFEFQALFGVPVAFEPNDGSYVLSDMPSQTTYTDAKGKIQPNTITRNYVPELKLMWQFTI